MDDPAILSQAQKRTDEKRRVRKVVRSGELSRRRNSGGSPQWSTSRTSAGICAELAGKRPKTTSQVSTQQQNHPPPRH